jgi:hypothetical protein
LALALRKKPPMLSQSGFADHFWCKGYYVDSAGKNAKRIAGYVKNQLQEDITIDQLTLKEYVDPFTGEPVNVAMKSKKPLKG